MARGRRGKGTKAKRKPAKARKPAKRAKAAARKPAKRRATKAKPSKARAKVPAKRSVAKRPRARKAAPPKPKKLEMDVIDVETIEEVAPGVAVVTDYEIIGVHPSSGRKQTTSRSPRALEGLHCARAVMAELMCRSDSRSARCSRARPVAAARRSARRAYRGYHRTGRLRPYSLR